MHRQARANLGRGANLGGYGELGDIADGDGGSGIDPGIDALVVDGTADLVEYGYDALLKRIGGGDTSGLERIDEFIRNCYLNGWLVNQLDIELRLEIHQRLDEEIEFE